MAKAAVEAAVKALTKPGETVSFTVTFDADNGSAVTTQTVTQGSTVQKPADPVKAGYTFTGWYAAGTSFLPALLVIFVTLPAFGSISKTAFLVPV